MVYIALTDQTAKQVQQFAQSKSVEAAAVVEQAVRTFLHTEEHRAIQREAEAFRSLHPELLQRYPGEYVAIYQGKLIDHDPDQMTLFIRIDEKYGNIPILIRQIRPEIEETITVRSPRFEYA